jgi:hypothetical protein
MQFLGSIKTPNGGNPPERGMRDDECGAG